MAEVRSPAFAGQFYAGSEKALKEQIEGCYAHDHGPGEIPEVEAGPRKLVGLVSPHAGYQFSGPVAAHGFFQLAKDGKPGSIVLLGPNHSSAGSGVSISPSNVWETPLGKVEVDTELVDDINSSCDIMDKDPVSHSREHSIEVQLPFVQYLFENRFKIAPICMMMQDEDTSKEVGRAIAEASKDKDVLIIASTDLTHYESQKSATSKDEKVIKKIEDLDWRGMVRAISERNISMCGYGPVSALLVASEELGADNAKLLKYATSGDTAGPSARVVGYSSIGVFK